MSAGAKISLLLPTRGRPVLLQRLFDSIVARTANLANIEIILYIDEDDFLTSKVSHPSLSLVKLIRPVGERMGIMNRLCFEASQGRYVMLMNDDVVFRTNGWDAKVIEGFSLYPDDVALVYGNDLHQGERLATLPVLSRQVCGLIGGICPREYHNTYIDLHLFDVFKKLAEVGHNRLVYLEDVIFEHMHQEAGKSTTNVTYVKRNENVDDLLFIEMEDDRWNQANTLERYIQERLAKLRSTEDVSYTDSRLKKQGGGWPDGVLKRWIASLFTRHRI